MRVYFDYPAIIAVFIASSCSSGMVSALGVKIYREEASSNTIERRWKRMLGDVMHRIIKSGKSTFLIIFELLIYFTVTTYENPDHYFQVIKRAARWMLI